MTAKVIEEEDLSRLKEGVRAVIQKDDAACDETFRRLVDQLHLLETKKDNQLIAPVP